MDKGQIPGPYRELFKPARYKAFYGGRGSAKSMSVAAALVVLAYNFNPDPRDPDKQSFRILCCREFQNSMKDSSKHEIENRIRAFGFEGFFRVLDTEIRGKNGSVFLFAGLRNNPDSLKSMAKLDILWVEEAATISKRSLELLDPTMRKPGSELWFTWNPRFPKDPVDKMFRGEGHETLGDSAIIREVNWDDNPFFPDELRKVKDRDQLRDPDLYRHTWLGQYKQSSEARVFHNFKSESFETPADARFYFGADWGFSRDPNVLIRCYITDKTLFVDREAYKVGCAIEATPALFDTIPGSRKWDIIADSARPETIDYMQRQGFKVRPSKKGAGSIEDGIEFLKNYDIVVHPRCPHTHDELIKYSFKVDKTTEEVLPVLDDKHNHVIDALRYAVESLRTGPRYPTAVVGSYQTRR